MRVPAAEDLQQSVGTGLWTTAAQNLNAAYRAGDTVILLFAIHRLNGFFGYGRMASEAVPTPYGPRSARGTEAGAGGVRAHERAEVGMGRARSLA